MSTHAWENLLHVQVNPYTTIVHENVLHFEVSLFLDTQTSIQIRNNERYTNLFGIPALVKLNERILERITGLFVSDDLAAHDRTKPRENKLEIFISCYWIEFAHKENVLGRSHVGEGKVADHLKCQS